LQKRPFDCVLIGAGIRKVDTNFNLFENMINAVHEYAPKAKICFNTNPMDTVQSVQRWL
jgi:malate/lactate dehydrogenase